MEPKKRPIWPWICAVAGVVAVLAAYFVFSQLLSPAVRAQRALELGEKYLLAGDYEQAVIQFTNVIDIAQQSPDTAYLVQEGQTRLDAAALGGAAAAAQAPGGDVQTAVTWLEQVGCGDLESVVVFRDVLSLLEELQMLCEQENYDGVFQRLSDESYKAQVAELLGLECQARLFDQDTGLMTAIYAMEVLTDNFAGSGDVNYMVYYGGHAPDETWQETDGVPQPELRSGDAIWLAYQDGNNYLASGPWEQDKPNGEFETRSWQQSLYSTVTYRIIMGQVVDGLWNGQVTWRFERGDQSDEYYPSFDMGRWQVQYYDNDGRAVVSETDHGDLVTDFPDEINGIAGYAPTA